MRHDTTRVGEHPATPINRKLDRESARSGDDRAHDSVESRWRSPHSPLRAERDTVFVAWRELRFARGRFLLIGAVVALITLLVGFLTGLAGGLASQNISAVLELPGDRVVLQQPANGDAKFATSSISPEAVGT